MFAFFLQFFLLESFETYEDKTIAKKMRTFSCQKISWSPRHFKWWDYWMKKIVNFFVFFFSSQNWESIQSDAGFFFMFFYACFFLHMFFRQCWPFNGVCSRDIRKNYYSYIRRRNTLQLLSVISTIDLELRLKAGVWPGGWKAYRTGAAPLFREGWGA